MSTRHPPYVSPLIKGPSDPIAIQDYLNLQNAGEIARLAASMAPQPKNFDPVALVGAAFALQTEAAADLIRRRETMADKMNFSTLLALARELGVSDKIHAGEDDEKLSDPVAGPVIRSLQTVIHGDSAACAARNAALIKEALASADARTKRPRPSLPCDLEDALLYAANPPSTPWPVLERAFKDFLGLYRLKDDTRRRQTQEAEQQALVDLHSRTLAKLKAANSHAPRHLSAVRETEQQLKISKENLGAWQAIRNYHENFAPGASQAPPTVTEETDEIYAFYWQPPGSVSEESSLVFFATDFHAFWHAHGKAYLRLHATTEKKKEMAAKQSRQAGAKGAPARDHSKWIERTTAFITYLKCDSKRKLPDAIQDSVTAFAAQHSGLTDRKAIAKLRDFLGTLCNPAACGWDAATTRYTLEKCGIKSCADATIHECLKLLNAALNRGREKK